jgi:tetrahydromethanopterin S-methyltransferase subunit D
MIDLILMVLILIGIAGVLIAVGVFFMPVGGAPAAMATAAGVATGGEMMATGAGVTGLFLAAAFYNKPLVLVLISSGVSSAIMMGVTMFVANLLVIYGKGVPPAFATKEYDPITKAHVKPYVTPGTVGHGMPTALFLGGIVGGFLAGVGGALAFAVMYRYSAGATLMEFLTVLPQTSPNIGFIALGVVTAVGTYLINSNIASYSIRGVIESWLDPKFKRLPSVVAACFLLSILFGVLIVLASRGVL